MIYEFLKATKYCDLQFNQLITYSYHYFTTIPEFRLIFSESDSDAPDIIILLFQDSVLYFLKAIANSDAPDIIILLFQDSVLYFLKAIAMLILLFQNSVLYFLKAIAMLRIPLFYYSRIPSCIF